MIEPPQPGFTGVVWEAREPDRLARDLDTGPGPLPMAEAGATWSRLATSFGAAAVEYEAIMVSLRGAWQSTASVGVHDRISALRDWLAGAAQAAAANAAKAQEHAAANELARLTMPNMADIKAIQEAQQMLQQIGISLGAPIQAIAAVTDTDSDIAKATASRVMRVYEAATEPLATPWVQDHPPELTSGTALAAEQAGAQVPKLPEPEGVPVLPPSFDPAAFAITPPMKTAYRAPSFVESTTAAEEAAEVVPASATSQIPAGGIPGAVAPGAAAAGLQNEEHRAGIAVEGADAIGIDNGIVSAPAVLGGSPAGPQQSAPGNAQSGAA
ncbi:PPE domain-containing protein [Nocardia miyunensis]|uniref:PPE domain-containing protein n=1 Tax=Nocardia miyunensis TaxID=282684 RepID=UPI000831BCEB|nr:PPE domain-containing protein [Nocardia miyunensis]